MSYFVYIVFWTVVVATVAIPCQFNASEYGINDVPVCIRSEHIKILTKEINYKWHFYDRIDAERFIDNYNEHERIMSYSENYCKDFRLDSVEVYEGDPFLVTYPFGKPIRVSE